MKRNISSLATKEYDLVIIGGGLFGVCGAWEATQRGLSVGIVDKRDFSHATSANHFKMVHGGIRYLQHGDIYRIRESSRERSAFLRIAPHLVQPIPIFIPTYGHGIKSKEFLGAGLLLYDFLTLDRNYGIQVDRRIPRGQFVSRREALEQFPYLKAKGLTGGAVFCDGQMYNPPRLAISFLRSAVNEGADAANYVEAIDFLRKGNRICGIQARDILTGNQLEIRSKMVLNTAGPWAHRLLENSLKLQLSKEPTFSRDLAFVIKRSINKTYGLACPTGSGDADALVDRGGRHLFMMPWKDHTLIGVWHMVFDGPPEEISVTEKELQNFIDEVNLSYPGLQASLNEISIINTGLTLFGMKDRQNNDNLSFGKRSQLIDHGREHNIEGLITLLGVRVTTARGMAEKAIDVILDRLKQKGESSKTQMTPIYGGDIDSFQRFLSNEIENHSSVLTTEQMRALIRNYGSHYREVLKYTKEDPTLIGNFKQSTVLKAEVIHAVREEMAQKLSDVVFRRTDLGTGGYPGEESLQTCAHLMSLEMGWDEDRLQRELKEIKNCFPHFYRNS